MQFAPVVTNHLLEKAQEVIGVARAAFPDDLATFDVEHHIEQRRKKEVDLTQLSVETG